MRARGRGRVRGRAVVAVLLAVRAPHLEAALVLFAFRSQRWAAVKRRAIDEVQAVVVRQRPCHVRRVRRGGELLVIGIERGVLPAHEPAGAPRRAARAGEQLVPALQAARPLQQLGFDRDRVPLPQIAEPHGAFALVARRGWVARGPLRHVHHRCDERDRVQYRAGRAGAGSSVREGDRDNLPAAVQVQRSRRIAARVGRLLPAPAEGAERAERAERHRGDSEHRERRAGGEPELH